jgi:transcriptional regulator with XRE-family HTH domain
MDRSTPLRDELPRVALGRFLRERREATAPQQVGISSHRGRRTPGLRREEVAFLADIGVKWYARLEAGDQIHPSEATLTGIAIALQLSAPELEYMLKLAGLRHPLLACPDSKHAIPEPMSALLRNVRGVAATVSDSILTPLQWNALGDAIYGHSRFRDPIERNGLVRGLFDGDFVKFLGSERDELVFRAVGMFRLNHASENPSPFTSAVYDRVKDHPLFQEAWNRRIVAGELSNAAVMTRHHGLVGKLCVYAVDAATPMSADLFLRVLVPADDETSAKFAELESRAMHEQKSLKSCSFALQLTRA